MNRQILHCDLHDYLEVACLHAIEVELTLNDGIHHIGIAITTRANRKTGEFLDFKDNQTVEIVSIPVLSIISMRAIKANPHFDEVVFSTV